DRLMVGDAEDPDLGLVVAGGEHGAVRTECQGPHHARDARELDGRARVRRIPEQDAPVAAAGGERPPVRAETEGPAAERVGGARRPEPPGAWPIAARGAQAAVLAEGVDPVTGWVDSGGPDGRAEAEGLVAPVGEPVEVAPFPTALLGGARVQEGLRPR